MFHKQIPLEYLSKNHNLWGLFMGVINWYFERMWYFEKVWFLLVNLFYLVISFVNYRITQFNLLLYLNNYLILTISQLQEEPISNFKTATSRKLNYPIFQIRSFDWHTMLLSYK